MGFLRVFDGSIYPQTDIIHHEKYKVAALSGHKIEAVHRDRALKHSFFKIGKYLISKSASPMQKIETRKMLLAWLKDKVMAAEEEDKTNFLRRCRKRNPPQALRTRFWYDSRY